MRVHVMETAMATAIDYMRYAFLFRGFGMIVLEEFESLGA